MVICLSLIEKIIMHHQVCITLVACSCPPDCDVAMSKVSVEVSSDEIMEIPVTGCWQY